MYEQVIRPVAVIHTEFTQKFGIPRQSGLVPELTGVITFEDGFKDRAAIRGIEEFSHLWLLWGFSQSKWDGSSFTVHPPRLGGKVKKGVFATRSPFRPNGIGISVVKLDKIVFDENDVPSLMVSGVDMLDGTPIFDIKPYMPYSDSLPQARGGFGQRLKDGEIEVVFPPELLDRFPPEKRSSALGLLRQDPRAAHNKAPGYVFGLSYAGMDIRFIAETYLSEDGEEHERLVVCDVVNAEGGFDKIK